MENNINVLKHLNMLGYRAKDKVTGFEGVITSVGFDLYGCIQAIVTPDSKEGKINDSAWFDIARLETTTTKPVMCPPNFETGIIAEGKKGPEAKPNMCRYK